MQERLPWPVFGIPIAMLAIALLPMPYGYYQFLRLVVCAATILTAIQAHRRSDQVSMAILGMLALLYNPVFRVHLNRETWAAINVATALAFGAVWYRFSRTISGQ